MKLLHIETPFFESHPISLQAGRAVWLKLEALQPFKSIVVIVCGGATASIEQLNQWSKL